MFYRKTWLSVCLATVFLLTGCSSGQKTVVAPTQPVELNVSAAMGLKDALLEIQKNYEAKHTNIKIVYNLASSGMLQSQIEQGASVDVFISAATKQMDELEKKGLIAPATRKNLVTDQLVLIVPKNSPLALQDFKDLADPKIKQFGMGAPETVPAGQYAQQVLEKLQVWDAVKGKAVLTKDIHTVLTYVETGNVEAGIVFSAVAATSDKVKIAAKAPAAMHSPIVFLGALLSNSKHTKEAEEFFKYVASPEGIAIFAKYGFSSIQ